LTITDRVPASDRLERPVTLVGLCVALYLPFTRLGYGTDIDVGNVLEAGHLWLDDGEYLISRAPGAAIHEVATAFLDDVGGSFLVNLASVAFAALALWALHELLRQEGSRIAGPAALVLATNPWFWIAATSLGDFVWAVGLLLAGAAAARRDRRVLAGLLFGLAIGCRLTTVLLVLSWLLAERVGWSSSRVTWRRSATTALVALGLGALCFVPSWLAFDRTFDFLDSQVPFDGLKSHIGRWTIKNAAFFGVLAGLVLAIGLPRLVRVWSTWRTSVTFRFALLAFVGAELAFFRFPFKLTHLIPAAMAVALVVGHFGTGAKRWIAVVIVAQLVGGVFTTTLGTPNIESRATGGTIELGPTEGPLLTDVQCRLDDRTRGGYGGTSPASERAVGNASCLIKTWRAED
jgi:hypothetical protein